MSSIYVQNFNSINGDHKELSLSKEINFKTKTEKFRCFDLSQYKSKLYEFLSHIYLFMIYKISKLQIQKCTNKGDMTKKPDLAQSFQKLITFAKHILFFWQFENRSVL